MLDEPLGFRGKRAEPRSPRSREIPGEETFAVPPAGVFPQSMLPSSPPHPEEAGGIGECSTSLWDFAEKEPNHEARAAAKSPARRHLPFRLPATAIGAEPFPPSPVTTRTSRHA
jgi:hypothetical protein